MLVRVPLVGTATPGDPLRCDLASWAYVGHDPVAGVMIVDIPDVDAPPNAPAPGDSKRPITVQGPVLTGLTPADVQAWRDMLVKRYPTQTTKLAGITPK